MESIEYIVSGPSVYDVADAVTRAADFLAGGFETFIVPIAWTFSQVFDETVYWIGDAIGISQ